MNCGGSCSLWLRCVTRINKCFWLILSAVLFALLFRSAMNVLSALILLTKDGRAETADRPNQKPKVEATLVRKLIKGNSSAFFKVSRYSVPFLGLSIGGTWWSICLLWCLAVPLSAKSYFKPIYLEDLMVIEKLLLIIVFVFFLPNPYLVFLLNHLAHSFNEYV